MFCTNCGQKIIGNFCSKCGQVAKTEILKKPRENNKYFITVLVFSIMVISLLVIIIYQNTNRFNNSDYAVIAQDSDNSAPITPKSYVTLEFYKELVIDERNAISVSPDGKYVLTYERDDKIFIIFIYQTTDYDGFSLLNSISIEERYLAGRFIDDGSIAWSNSGDSFAIGSTNGVITSRNSYIIAYHIATNELLNLTNTSNRVSHLEDGDFYIDMLPAWSSDDSVIYFSRFGGRGRSSGIFSVPAYGGQIRLIRGFDERVTLVFPALFARGDVLYYNLDSSHLGSRNRNIEREENGSRTIIVQSPEGYFATLRSVSEDGQRLVYTLDSLDRTHNFFVMDASFPNSEIELSPISSSMARINNVLFSPDGFSLLQIEWNAAIGNTYFYMIDAINPESSQNLVYVIGNSSPFIGGLSYTRNFSQLQPRWLTGDIIAINDINGGFPFLLRALAEN